MAALDAIKDVGLVMVFLGVASGWVFVLIEAGRMWGVWAFMGVVSGTGALIYGIACIVAAIRRKNYPQRLD